MLFFGIPTGRLDKPEVLAEKIQGNKPQISNKQETPQTGLPPLVNESDNFYFKLKTDREEIEDPTKPEQSHNKESRE